MNKIHSSEVNKTLFAQHRLAYRNAELPKSGQEAELPIEKLSKGEALRRANKQSEDARRQANELWGGSIDTKESKKGKKELVPTQKAKLFLALKARLNKTPKHYKRPEGIKFKEVKKALEANPELMWSLYQMEKIGGEPDIIQIYNLRYVFADCSLESPSGRRNVHYKKAADQAREFGVRLMTKEQYKSIQKLGTFDTKSFSWLESSDIVHGNIAYTGTRDNGDLEIYMDNTYIISVYQGWRGVLMVRKYN